MGVDHFIDFGHDADGFAEGDDDLLVVGNVVVGATRDLWATFRERASRRDRKIISLSGAFRFNLIWPASEATI